MDSCTDNSNETVGKERQLFGGALSCILPANVHDVSVIRDVPDHQEVFCHESTDQSIMIDILEYQSHVVGEHAVRYHFEDIASVNDAGSEHEVVEVEAISRDKISMEECSEAWFLSGRQMVSKFNETNHAENLIHIYLVLYRLPQYQTDLLIILNNPVAISKGSSSSISSSPNCPGAWQIKEFKQMACTLKLIDSGLFGEE